MARKFTKVSEDVFKECVIDSGILLNKFDVTGETEVEDADIVCDTTGDISATCVPTFSDMGEDVNNCPVGMMELMNLDGWETRLAFTALNATAETIHLALGAADVDAETGRITPRRSLDTSKDFRDVWLVCNLMGGGFAAIHLINALSTAGLSLTTTKNGKGQLQIELGGHVSIKAQDVVPMEFYVSAEEAA